MLTGRRTLHAACSGEGAVGVLQEQLLFAERGHRDDHHLILVLLGCHPGRRLRALAAAQAGLRRDPGHLVGRGSLYIGDAAGHVTPKLELDSTKGTGSLGKRRNKTHMLCIRYGRRSFHLQKSTCSSCVYPASRIRKYGPAEDLYGMFINKVRRERLPEMLGQVRGLTKWVPPPVKMTRSYVEENINRSRKRMDVAAFDMLQFHWWDYANPGYLDALKHITDLKEEV
ncbi:hypothetical protein ZWY2020_014898 [Hordeum vulgare]|nr:hypothetical protein ZWY2020_014898 [Hordeum vulgare]